MQYNSVLCHYKKKINLLIYTSWFQEYFVVNGSILGFVSFFTLFGPCSPSKRLSNVTSNSLIRRFDTSNYHLNDWNCFDDFIPNLSNHHKLCDKGLCFQNVKPSSCCIFQWELSNKLKIILFERDLISQITF